MRHHLAPRLALFSPMSVDAMPCDFQDILPRRVTFLRYEDGTEEKFEDEWTSPDDPIKRQGKYWTGRTEVDVKEPVQDSALPDSAPPFSEDGPEIAGGDGLRTPADGLRSPGDDGLRTPNQGPRAPATPGGGDATLRRRRARTRQLQRGFWQELEAEDVAGLLEDKRSFGRERGKRLASHFSGGRGRCSLEEYRECQCRCDVDLWRFKCKEVEEARVLQWKPL